MILIITNKIDYTADFLILELKRRDIGFIRFNTEDFPTSVSISMSLSPLSKNIDGQIITPNQVVDFGEIKSIWYRRPHPPMLPQEKFDQISKDFITAESRYTLDSLWRTIEGFWVSHPDKIRIAEAKFHQLIKANQLGLNIPNTLITNSREKVENFFEKHNKNIIYKPQKYTYVQSEESPMLIYTSVINEEKAQYFDGVEFVPSLFQDYISKSSELRITVVGDEVLATQIHSQEHQGAIYDWRRPNAMELRHTPYDLPNDIAEKCARLVKSYELAFSAIDMIVTPEGEYVFLEMNPNGQWAWIEQMCPEIKIRDSLINLLLREQSS